LSLPSIPNTWKPAIFCAPPLARASVLPTSVPIPAANAVSAVRDKVDGPEDRDKGIACDGNADLAPATPDAAGGAPHCPSDGQVGRGQWRLLSNGNERHAHKHLRVKKKATCIAHDIHLPDGRPGRRSIIQRAARYGDGDYKAVPSWFMV